MSARILRGDERAQALLDEAAKDAGHVSARAGRKPRLVALEVAREGATGVFGKKKRQAAREVGVETKHVKVDPALGEDAFAAKLMEIAQDSSVDAITIERPLPRSYDVVRLQELIPPEKDVEGLHPQNVGRLVSGAPVRFVPPAAEAALLLLRDSDLALEGARVVVVGAGFGVGRPVSLLLLDARATVEICHDKTKDVAACTRTADAVVSCAGVPGLIRPDMIRPGAVVIDVGTTVVLDAAGERCVKGDVDPRVAEVASCVTPVPGGVGPVTVALVLRNAARAARRAIEAIEKAPRG